MRKSSSIAIKIFSLPRSSAWELGHQSGRKIAVDLFFVRRTDKVETVVLLSQGAKGPVDLCSARTEVERRMVDSRKGRCNYAGV